MTDRPVLIVGAGPTGLVLALWLTRLGISVRIIDKTAEPGTTSRALAVQARTLEFYHQVGLTDAVIAGGVKIANLNFWVKGARAARVPLQGIAFARRLVATTDRGFTLATTRGFVARFVRTRLVPLLVPWLFRLSPWRRLMFQTLSQIGINYRNSPLSAGAAGAVRGGDRLPWVEMEPGQEHFAALTSLQWQVHV